MTRLGYFLMTFIAVLAFGWSLIPHMPRLIWNASASAPIGLYALKAETIVRDGDLVALLPPAPLARFLAMRHYLPRHVLLLKHVAALHGQIVCRQGPAITVDGLPAASALVRDHAGRPLPRWQGCHRVTSEEIFLLNSSVRDSLDGRYFGLLPISSLLGRAVPLWLN